MLTRRDLCLVAIAPLAQQAIARVDGGSPFALGIASGEPDENSVVLWTRLAPRPLEPNGGMADHTVQVGWRLWRHDGQLARKGVANARPQDAHSVHVLAENLTPGTRYLYQFNVGDHRSAIGSTRTLPSPFSDVESLRFATVCCQNFTHGYFSSYRELLRSRPEFILHLGDYIYEVDFGGTVRRHPPGGPPRTLDRFRLWHALYKTDPSLTAAHAAFPFYSLLDNHDAAVDGGSKHDALREAAYRAWAEHMPVRIKGAIEEWAPTSRSLAWGRLAHLELLETRRSRDMQDVCASADGQDPGFGLYRLPCDAHVNPNRRIMGEKDERNVVARLWRARNKHAWVGLASSVPIGSLPLFSGSRIYAASWDAYPAARQRLLLPLSTSCSAGVVGLSGDIHAALISELKMGDNRVGFDLVTTSLTSECPPPLAAPLSSIRDPAVHLCNPNLRGFTMHTLTAEQWSAEFHSRRLTQPEHFITTTANLRKTSADAATLSLSLTDGI